MKNCIEFAPQYFAVALAATTTFFGAFNHNNNTTEYVITISSNQTVYEAEFVSAAQTKAEKIHIAANEYAPTIKSIK